MLGISEGPHFWPGSTSVLLQRNVAPFMHRCKIWQISMNETLDFMFICEFLCRLCMGEVRRRTTVRTGREQSNTWRRL